MYKNVETYRNISDYDYGYSNDIIYKCDEYCDECGEFIHHELMEYEPPRCCVSYCEACKKKYSGNNFDEGSEDSSNVTEETCYVCPICNTSYNTEEESKNCYRKCQTKQFEHNIQLARTAAEKVIRINNLNKIIEFGHQLIDTMNLLEMSDNIFFTEVNDSMLFNDLSSTDQATLINLWTTAQNLFTQEVLPKIESYFSQENAPVNEAIIHKKVKVTKVKNNNGED